MPVTTNNSASSDQESERVLCADCSETIAEGEIEVVDDLNYCRRCFDERFTICNHCEEPVDNDSVNYIQDENCYLCPSCYDNGDYFSCDSCGERYHIDSRHYFDEDSEDYDEDNYTCQRCYERHNTRQGRSYPDLDNKELIDKNKGKIVKSARKFGIELECLYNKTDAPKKLQEVAHKAWGFTSDGSIRRSKDAVGTAELISPIMAGKLAEDEIKKLTKTARDVGYFVNTSCGFHLHLDAPDYKRKPEDDREYESDALEAHEVYYKVTDGKGEQWTYRHTDEIPPQLRKFPIEKVVKDKNTKIIINTGENFYRVRDLLFVYLAFDDVFRGMQPKSRRSNQFCKCVSSAYSIGDVKRLMDYGELERLWYQVDRRRKLEHQIADAESRKRGKDATRYVGFNLEPLLRENSRTIEIRYHSPTLNAEKILRWIDIHQTILDYVAGGIDERAINHVLSSETHLIRKAKALCKLFKIQKSTEEYMTERLHKFNQIKEAQEDEEVELSEIGRPLQHAEERLMERPEPLTMTQVSRANRVRLPRDFGRGLTDYITSAPTFRTTDYQYIADIPMPEAIPTEPSNIQETLNAIDETIQQSAEEMQNLRERMLRDIYQQRNNNNQ